MNSYILCFIFVLFFPNYSYLVKVLWLSIDGFSPRYINEENTPVMLKLISSGTSSLTLAPCFPSVTFANHQSLATGLYPESHGIIQNKMKVPRGKAGEGYPGDFRKNTRDRKWWDVSKDFRPIFVANELAGNGRKSSSIYWPGDSVPYGDRRISKSIDIYDPKVGMRERINMAISDLNSHNLVNVYVYEVDKAGHEKGPNSAEVKAKVQELDKILQVLIDAVKQHGDVNLIITSDHGMAEIEPTKKLDSQIVFRNIPVDVVTYGAIVTLYPACSGDTCSTTPAEVVTRLNSKTNKHYTAYLKQDLPSNLHYSLNERIPPVVVITEKGWIITDEVLKERRGDHGWDVADFSAMNGIFIGVGPSFPKNHRVDNISNLDIYPLVCKILDIEKSCHSNNGSRTVVDKVLVSSLSKNTIIIIVIVVVATVIFIGLVIAFIVWKKVH